MRVLVTSHPGLGHLTGLVALARALADDGNEVLAAGAPSVARAFAEAGLGGTAVVPEPAWSDSPQIHGELPHLRSVHGPERLAVVHAEIGIRRRALALLDPLTRLVRDWRPTVLLRDATEMAAWVVAERHGLPHVSYEVSVHWPEERWSAEIGDALRELQALAGLPVDDAAPAAGMYRYLHLNNAPPALRDPAVRLPPTAVDVTPAFYEDLSSGRSLAPPVPAVPGADAGGARDVAGGPGPAGLPDLADVPDLAGLPDGYVYVAFGSVYQPPRSTVAAVVGALARDFPGVVAVGDLLPAGPGVVVRPYVPQTPCMPRCALVLCHGGRNTVLTAMRAGVPVVCAPIGSDHFDVARLAERAGAGRRCDWDGDALVAAAREVGGDPTYRRGAQAVAAQIAAMPSLAETATLLRSRFG